VSLLSTPSRREQVTCSLFSAMLRSICIPGSHKLFNMLPETLTQTCVLPLSGDRLADARFLQLVLSDAICGPLLQSVFGWQGTLRSMVSDLLSLRQKLLQVRKHMFCILAAHIAGSTISFSSWCSSTPAAGGCCRASYMASMVRSRSPIC
jgi:hypothetical protein